MCGCGPDLCITVALLAGKSSLLNAICGEERSIVCDMSGTTRDAVDTTITLPDGQQLTLIDTAGIRKRARVADSKCVEPDLTGSLQWTVVKAFSSAGLQLAQRQLQLWVL